MTLKNIFKIFTKNYVRWPIIAVLSWIPIVYIDYNSFHFIDNILSPKYLYTSKFNDEYISYEITKLKERYPELISDNATHRDALYGGYVKLKSKNNIYVVEYHIEKRSIRIIGVYFYDLEPYRRRSFPEMGFWERGPICKAFKEQVINRIELN